MAGSSGLAPIGDATTQRLFRRKKDTKKNFGMGFLGFDSTLDRFEGRLTLELYQVISAIPTKQ